MKQYLIILLAVISIACSASAQEDSLVSAKDTLLSVNEPIAPVSLAPVKKQPVFKLNLPVDLPLTAVTCGTTLYLFSQIYNKERLTVEEVESLDPRNVNRFDRSATRHFNESASRIGDYLFYGSMPLPFVFLLDKKIRKDFPRVTLLYLEAMGITGIIYSSSVHFADRYRPYTYNDAAPMDFKLRGGSRNSFFAGHPALVGTSTFFMASVYAAYHPESKIKWLFYTVAAAATAGTATARYLGGRHFPSDLIIGITLGPLSGMLIPRIHKNKDLSKRSTLVLPFFGQSSGLALVHKF